MYSSRNDFERSYLNHFFRNVDLNAEIRIPVGIMLPSKRPLHIGSIVNAALKSNNIIPPGFFIIISTKVTSSCPTYDELQFSHLINGLELK